MSLKDHLGKLAWALGILVVAGAGIVGWRYLNSHQTSQTPTDALSHEIELDRKAGVPLEPNDIRPNPPIPEGQNAAQVYRALYPRIQLVYTKYPNLRDELFPVMKGTGTLAQRQDVEKALASADGTLVELAAASKRPYCDFHYPFEQGANMLFPEFAQARKIANLLVAKAYMLGEHGRIDQAYDVLAHAESVGKHMGQTPFLIAMLVQISIEGIVLTEFDRLLQKSTGNATLLDKAQQALDTFGPYASLLTAFRGDLIMGRTAIHTIHTMRDLETVSTGGAATSNEPLAPSMLKAFEVKFLTRWREAFAIVSPNPNEWLAAYPRLKAVDDRISADHSVDNIASVIAIPNLEQAALAIGRQQAKRNLAATSIRLMKDHLRTGVYPPTLPTYGQISIDPFDGKPLRYRRVGAGFTIYSIGPDFKDHGGHPPQGRQHGDIVVTFR